ncbi:hypothetical protein VE02_07126 [Pseudogymnoascus sp. 03VT05]|nr:hypothetical protein VE02_07126 [Pseudogymnoascus sp. 03VT05]
MAGTGGISDEAPVPGTTTCGHPASCSGGGCTKGLWAPIAKLPRLTDLWALGAKLLLRRPAKPAFVVSLREWFVVVTTDPRKPSANLNQTLSAHCSLPTPLGSTWYEPQLPEKHHQVYDYRQARLTDKVAQEDALLVGGSAAVNFALEGFHLHGRAQYVDPLVPEKYQRVSHHSGHRRLVEIQDETHPASVTLSPDLLALYGPRDRDMGFLARPAPKLDCRGGSGQIVFDLSLQHWVVVP